MRRCVARDRAFVYTSRSNHEGAGMAEKISDAALDTLFRKARSYGTFAPEPVTDAQLHAIYEIMKHGPTTANSQPQRIVFLRSEAARQRLAPALSKTNR